jgi:predicted Zn-dependent protease
MLSVMKKNLKAGGFDFAKTHPAPDDRIAEIRKGGLGYATVQPPAARQNRFQQTFGTI